jgi:CDP-glucose 4,6-dehydratase
MTSHFCDLRDATPTSRHIENANPEVVFHLAAQPLVRAGYRNPLETFTTNVIGTAQVLDALRAVNGVRVAVVVTTDKVYSNREWHYPYREDDALGGHDPYSASKAAVEIVTDSFRHSFLAERGVAVASARAGNVIGGGDWSDDRLLPDAMRAWQAGATMKVRRPDAVRPWQHVLEPLSGYLALAERLWMAPALAGAYNFGPHPQDAETVRTVVELARAAYGSGNVSYGSCEMGPYESGWLALETAKARIKLDVRPRWTLGEAVTRAVAWYRAQREGTDARNLCYVDIAAYEATP